MKELWVGVIVILLAGCTREYIVNPSSEETEAQQKQAPLLFRPDGQESQQAAKPPPAAQASSVGGIVDTMAQGNALRAGRRAGEQIRAVSAQEDRNMKEIESE
jgi:hypothetical protein